MFPVREEEATESSDELIIQTIVEHNSLSPPRFFHSSSSSWLLLLQVSGCPQSLLYYITLIMLGETIYDGHFFCVRALRKEVKAVEKEEENRRNDIWIPLSFPSDYPSTLISCVSTRRNGKTGRTKKDRERKEKVSARGRQGSWGYNLWRCHVDSRALMVLST